MSNKRWTTGYDAEGHSVITHDDYGHVPAWSDDVANTLAALLNHGLMKPSEYKVEYGDVLIFGEGIDGNSFRHVAVRDTSGAEPYWKYKTSMSGYNTVEEQYVNNFQLIHVREGKECQDLC